MCIASTGARNSNKCTIIIPHVHTALVQNKQNLHSTPLYSKVHTHTQHLTFLTRLFFRLRTMLWSVFNFKIRSTALCVLVAVSLFFMCGIWLMDRITRNAVMVRSDVQTIVSTSRQYVAMWMAYFCGVVYRTDDNMASIQGWDRMRLLATLKKWPEGNRVWNTNSK